MCILLVEFCYTTPSCRMLLPKQTEIQRTGPFLPAGQACPGRLYNCSRGNLDLGVAMTLAPPHKQDWDIDVTSQVLDVQRSNSTASSNSTSHCVNTDSFHVKVMPEMFSEEFSVTPAFSSDVFSTLDTPRCMPDPRTEGKASKNLRCMPGLSPDENLLCLYDVNASPIKNHITMVSTCWPAMAPLAAEKFPDFADAYTKIVSTALPNFLGAKLTVKSDLKVHKWRQYLENYHDPLLCEFLQFSWPIGYKLHKPPQSIDKNHPSADAHMSHVRKFIEIEMEHGALLGPFDSPPFQPWTRISPVMTRAKKDSDDRRIIVDLSFPAGASVNDGIDPLDHLGKDITYSLPSIMDLVTQIQIQGHGCFLWKADLTRAYRQLRSDPADAPLLGIKIDSKIYLDRCPPFGYRSSASICQRVANSLVYMMANQGFYMIAYLDDFGGCHASKTAAYDAYDSFKTLAKELGLQLARHKCFPPTTSIEWLGYEVDTNKMSDTIPAQKLKEILQECQQWLTRSHANKKMIQQIAGKLIFLCNCVQQGRKFMARILATLRDMKDRQWTTITDSFKVDIRWFCQYAAQGNGIFLCAQCDQFHLECDSSLHGAGGNSSKEYYFWSHSTDHKEKFPHIYQLEAVNVVVAYKTLAIFYPTTPTHVTIWTDNITSSFALETGRTKDEVLGLCAHELWLDASKRNHTIEIKHKRGTLLPLADALSRLSQDHAKAALANEIVARRDLQFVPPHVNDYKFFDLTL